jgi:hypothetical protein
MPNLPYGFFIRHSGWMLSSLRKFNNDQLLLVLLLGAIVLGLAAYRIFWVVP